MDKLTVMDYIKNPDLLVPLPIFRLYHVIRHPINRHRTWKKWRDRPDIGDFVEDCRYEIRRVVGLESENVLILDDGSTVSWMDCCDRPRVRISHPARDGRPSYITDK